jgi:hypothetical protein
MIAPKGAIIVGSADEEAISKSSLKALLLLIFDQ